MDSMRALKMGEAARAAGNKMKVFDWDAAARLIKHRGATEAAAGLIEDWGWTGGDILRDGKPVAKEEAHVYLCSLWATPTLRLCGETIACWRWLTDLPGLGEDAYWPDSALAILGPRN